MRGRFHRVNQLAGLFHEQTKQFHPIRRHVHHLDDFTGHRGVNLCITDNVHADTDGFDIAVNVFLELLGQKILGL